MNQTEPILIWAWSDAPDEYKQLSTNGGDEDWVAFFSPEIWEWYGQWPPDWMTRWGICDTDIYHADKGIVVIGCHA